jgi:phospholipid-transporting ATPase
MLFVVIISIFKLNSALKYYGYATENTNVSIVNTFLLVCTSCVFVYFTFIVYKYLSLSEKFVSFLANSTQNFAYNLLTFLILFNNLIPISLQVTLEVVRFIQAIFINMDIKMYHEESDTPAMARTSNLNEELGQVKYIFSDKTGTLTRNVMEFKRCAIGHDVYDALADNVNDALIVKHLRQEHKNAELIKELLVLLSVCHTVIPEKMPDGSVVYHAASPDERALVYGASRFGYVFKSRTPSFVEIDALGEKQRYEILSVLEFSSARKRMSVIVKDPEGKIKLFCKGADTVIYERLDSLGREHSDVLLQHLENFATEGLRTLCCAVVELTKEDYEEWKKLYHKATISLQHREEKVEEAANLIERKLKLIGATAIEDKLQDGVPEAIATLLNANINIWVLTGDKQETAINIGYSCKLLSHGMQHILLNEEGLDVSGVGLSRATLILSIFRTPESQFCGTTPSWAKTWKDKTTSPW